MVTPKRAVCAAIAFLLGASVFGQPAQWSRIKIDTIYEHWLKNQFPSNDLYVDDVVNLKPPPGSFMAQSLANPHVLLPDDQTNDWIIGTYGTKLDGPGDSIYVLRRHSIDGDYDIPSSAALPGVSGHGLGAGMAMVKAPVATSTGRRYFGLVPVLGSTGWITWASLDANGSTWSFLGANGTAVTDPLSSVKLIRRADLSGQWQHPSIVYARILNVDYFFVVVGYSGACGITASWFRLTFDPSNSNGFGLKFDTGLNSYLVQRWNGSSFINTNGEVDNQDLWQCASVAPTDASGNGNGAADPMDLVSLKKADGSFDSILFVYMPVRDFGKSPSRLAYSKASLPTTATGNFQWGPLHVLDTSILWDRNTFSGAHTYNACGSGGGNYMGVNQGTAGLADKLFGHIACYRDDQYSSTDPGCFWNCGDQPQGLLPVLLKQQTLGIDSISPSSGPRTGGTSVTIAGEGFAVGATVKVGGSMATNVQATASSITARTPAHSAGVANVSVSVGADSDVVSNSFVFDFDDVSSAYPDHAAIATLVRNGVTVGCGTNTFCPDSPVTRGQMAPFLLKSRYGFRYPPPPPEPFFTDVPSTNQFSAWIDAIFRMGITAGCSGTGTCSAPDGNTQYCPDNNILRQQMAVFLLKTAHYTGNPYLPPSCSSSGISIPDVACPSPFADWIYEAVKRGFMLTCGTGTYTCSLPCVTGGFCPNAPVTRKAMAQHLVSTFSLK